MHTSYTCIKQWNSWRETNIHERIPEEIMSERAPSQHFGTMFSDLWQGRKWIYKTGQPSLRFWVSTIVQPAHDEIILQVRLPWLPFCLGWSARNSYLLGGSARNSNIWSTSCCFRLEYGKYFKLFYLIWRGLAKFDITS